MINSFNKHPLWMLISSLLFVYFMFITMYFPSSFINIQSNKNGELVVNDISHESAFYKAGLREGDIILLINNKQANLHLTYKKYRKIELVNTITFKRNKDVFNNITIEKSYTLFEHIKHLIIPIIFFIFCATFCIIIIRTERKQIFHHLLFYFLLLICLAFVSGGASFRGDILARIITSFTFIFSPVVLFHLILSLLKNNLKISINREINIKKIYFFAVVFSAIAIVHETTNIYIKLLDELQLVYFLLFLIFIFIFLFTIFFKNKCSKQSPALKLLLIGIFFSTFPFVFLHSFTQILFNFSILIPELASLFFILLPLTIFYLVHKEQIIDIDFFIKWLRKDLLFSVVAGFIFFVISTTKPLEKAVTNSVYVTIISFVILLINNPIRSTSPFRVQSGQLDDKLNQFFKRIEKESSPAELVDIICEEVKRVISEIQTAKSFQLMQTDIGFVNNSNNKFVSHLANELQSLQLKNIPIGKIISINKGFCVLLHKKENRLLFLYCSNKNNRTELNPVEKAWIETLAHYSNVLLSNQYSIESVIHELQLLKENDGHYSQWLSNFLFNFTERERVRLAGDLHDSVLQDLLYIHMNLQKITKEPISPILRQQIEHICELVLDCAHTTREACNRLSPPFLLQYGLLETLQELIKKTHLQSNFRVELNRLHFSDDDLHEEHTIALFRIVQELLSNATKHSNAKTVSLRLAQVQNAIVLEYQDDGVGFPIDHFKKDYANFNGLVNMQERVKSLSGSIQFFSENGLQVQISLPIRFTHPVFLQKSSQMS